MTSWQKRARLGVLIFGLAVGALVYFGMGERVPQAAPRPPVRTDPTAMVEALKGSVERVQGTEREFDVAFDRSLTYSDNSTRMFGIRIKPRERDGKQFVVTAREAQVGQGQRVLQLAGDIKVTASDGFEMATEVGTFNQDDALALAPGPVKFGRGRMSGSGVNVTYNTNKDVLVVTSEAHIVTTSEDGSTMLDFTAGAATLDRVQHLLTLDGSVHVLRGEQTFDGDRAVAFLNEGNDVVTRIEMRGNSRVTGGTTSFDGMNARDIDLDYTEDGGTLEQAMLQGAATLAMVGQNGSPGRQMSGERLELALDAEGYLTRAIGHDNVKLAFPAADDVPARTIEAQNLDGVGAPGKGLTSARFTGGVVFREQATAGKMDRLVRSGVLQTILTDDNVTGAVFTGGTTFEEQGFNARAPTVNYAPGPGTLELRDADAKGGPRVEDERMIIDARRIDVTLGERRFQGRENVLTTLQAGATKGKAGSGKASGSRLPGVFKQDETATVNAGALDYSGESGRAVYTVGATLQQGPNTIRADRLELDQESGDLVAAGDAQTRLEFADGESVGRAREIRFDDERRTITYATTPGAPGQVPPARGTAAQAAGRSASAPGTPAPAPAPAARGASTPVAPLAGPALATLKGRAGELRGQTITVSLATAENRVERVEAVTSVSIRLDAARTVTGARLIYYAADERYVISGTSAAPVKLVNVKPPDCSEATGMELTFNKPTDRMTMDGKGETRTNSLMKPCTSAPAR